MLLKVVIIFLLLGLTTYGVVSAYEDIRDGTELTITEEIKKQCFDEDIRNQNFQEIELGQCLMESVFNG